MVNSDDPEKQTLSIYQSHEVALPRDAPTLHVIIVPHQVAMGTRVQDVSADFLLQS